MRAAAVRLAALLGGAEVVARERLIGGQGLRCGAVVVAGGRSGGRDGYRTFGDGAAT
jgi:hypothetical protein